MYYGYYVITPHFFTFFQGHQGQSKLEKDSTQRGIPNSWRTKKALSTLRSNFAFTGTSRTNRKNKASNIQYIASQCFIHTGDPEPKPLDVWKS